MSLITVDEALDRVFALLKPLSDEPVPLTKAGGRVLARDVVSNRDQPPFPASAMDGYALTGAQPGASFKVIGESAAGRRFDGAVPESCAVRIFTGAPVPPGATQIVIQEDVDRSGDTITLKQNLDTADYIRPAGSDLHKGMTLPAGRRLTPAEAALCASMGVDQVHVTRRPKVAILATGDELIAPGEMPGPDQIIASNGVGLKAMLEQEGAAVRLLPIARDTTESLETAMRLAEGSDLLITIGGASVGDHDLVRPVAGRLGMTPAFYKVAMRPGKPLMAGRVLGVPMFGLPGNPVSSMVCGHIFIRPALRLMLGLGAAAMPREAAVLAADIPKNGPREHYMRASWEGSAVRVATRQDSSLLSVLSTADALVVRAPHAPEAKAGTAMDVIRL